MLGTLVVLSYSIEAAEVCRLCFMCTESRSCFVIIGLNFIQLNYELKQNVNANFKNLCDFMFYIGCTACYKNVIESSLNCSICCFVLSIKEYGEETGNSFRLRMFSSVKRFDKVTMFLTSVSIITSLSYIILDNVYLCFHCCLDRFRGKKKT